MDRSKVITLLMVIVLGVLMVDFLSDLDFNQPGENISTDTGNEEALNMLWGEGSNPMYVDLRLVTVILALVLFVSISATTYLLSEDELNEH